MTKSIPVRVSNPAGLRQPNYPENQWWVAATVSEIGAEPVQRWILGLPIVLYRGGNGKVVALDNRCPHRWAPLSMGWIKGNDIVCRYHGLQFGPDGGCTLIPTQTKVPSVAKVRSYPVLEQAPFVWIWTGDPARVDPAEQLPDLGWTVDPARLTAAGAMEFSCNYMALKENVLDLSHFAYVHANTLAVTDWTSPPTVARTSNSVGYNQTFLNSPLPAHYGVPTGIGCERPVDRSAWGTYVSPALQLAGVDIEDKDAGPNGRRSFALRILHATTPIDESHCYYWWYFSQDYGHEVGTADALKARITATFIEDQAILEATETMVRQDQRGRETLEISVLCDQAGIEARRMLQRTLDKDGASLEAVIT